MAESSLRRCPLTAPCPVFRGERLQSLLRARGVPRPGPHCLAVETILRARFPRWLLLTEGQVSAHAGAGASSYSRLGSSGTDCRASRSENSTVTGRPPVRFSRGGQPAAVRSGRGRATSSIVSVPENEQIRSGSQLHHTFQYRSPSSYYEVQNHDYVSSANPVTSQLPSDVL